MKMGSRVWTTALMMVLGVTSMQCSKGESSKTDGELPSGMDLSTAQKVEIQDTAGMVVLSGTFANHKASLTGTDPSAKAEGSVDLEIDKKDNGLKQEVEASVEDLAASTSYKIVIDGKEVATFTTDDKGKKEMKFASKDGS
ncbi:MAG: hypothetical protein ABIU54_05435 [Candidatus Eisenbacteria bacterium]